MFTETDLLAAIELYLAKTGESAASFGKRIAGDPSLISDLRAGRSPTMRLAQKIMAAIERANPSSDAAA